MTQEEYEALISRLEEDAGRRPALYKLKVALLACLGYGYILLILALVLIMVALLVWVAVSGRAIGLLWKLGISLLVLAYLIARALWIRIPPPEGIRLSAREAPRVFETADELRRILHSPPLHRILLTDEYNASVAQIPRLGVLGWRRNYLCLGLPLMQALSPDQLKAVLGHEFGHLSGSHGRFGCWVYRIRLSYNRLAEGFDKQEHWGAVFFRRFFHWYVPIFGAHSFVLARAHEYAADRCAADLVGRRGAADMLMNLRVGAMLLEQRFWSTVNRRADDEPNPPSHVYEEMQRTLLEGADERQVKDWIALALKQEPGSADTHPSLTDRLKALGEEARPPEPLRQPAADHFLGESLGRLRESLNRRWRECVEPSWKQRYGYIQQARARLEELGKKAKHGPLTPQEAWQRAHLTEEAVGPDAAFALYQEVLRREPDNADASFAMGRILLARNEADGIAAIQKAMKLSAEYIPLGCATIGMFLAEQGQVGEAKRYFEKASQQQRLLALARAERSRLSVRDVYLPHELPGEAVAQLKQQLSRHPQIVMAYLAQRAMSYLPENPAYLLAIRLSRLRLRSRAADGKLRDEIARQINLPGDGWIYLLNSGRDRMRSVLAKVPDSVIYRR